MLRHLRLSNFQAWESLDLPLSPITVIIGETNAGKSSIMRALSCVLFNAIEGQGMVRHGASVAEVNVELDDATHVTWMRGTNVNRYRVNDRVYDKPGRAVPEDVQQALAVHELEFDGEVVRLQWAPQMDAPFLLADSGAKATRMLGVVGNAAIVAQAQRLSQQEAKTQREAVRLATAQVERLRDQVASFADVEQGTPCAERLADCLTEVSALRQRLEVVRRAAAYQAEARQRVASLQAQQQVAERRRQGLAALMQAKRAQDVAVQYRAVVAKTAHYETLLEQGRGLLTSAQFALRQLSEVKTFQRLCEHAEKVRAQCQEAHDQFAAAQARRDKAAAAYHALVQTLTCPTCGRIKEAA